jgi:hypothetical protein
VTDASHVRRCILIEVITLFLLTGTGRDSAAMNILNRKQRMSAVKCDLTKKNDMSASLLTTTLWGKEKGT